MSLHASLKRAEKMTSFRSVLTRIEKLKLLKAKGEWSEADKVLGLPKIKVQKVKVTKQEKEKATTTQQGSQATATAKTESAKPTAKSK